MELFAVWKAFAIAMTGTFGILGLATDFRQKRSKKITKWRYLSLTGIIASTIGGVWLSSRKFCPTNERQRKTISASSRS